MAIIFLATTIRSAFGFGEALVAVPLLAFFVPLSVAAPLAVLLSITIATVVVAQDWRHIHWRSAAGLVVATVFGIPLGLVALASSHQQMVKAGLGILIALFGAFSLFCCDRFRMREERRSIQFLFGFAAGVLGGAYGMNGPPLAIYGTMRRWSPQHFRATLQAYFLPASVLGMIGYWSAGLWTRTVSQDYLFCLPAMLPAVWLGRFVNRRMNGSMFVKYVHGGLIVIGIGLFFEAVMRSA